MATKVMKDNELRIIFMGTPEFAVTSLAALVDGGYNVVCVVTVADKPAGRGQKLQQSAVKLYALANGIKVLQPEKLKDESFVEELRILHADLQVIVAFRMLPEVVWNMPRLGTFNLHASLLPLYRGAAPLNWAVINGDLETGVTTFLLQHQIDTGNILFSEKISIAPDETVGSVHDRLKDIGALLVVKTVKALASGEVRPVPQESLPLDLARLHAPKIYKEDCHLDFRKGGEQLFNLIRGLSPYPAAWCELTSDGGVQGSIRIFYGEFVPALHQMDAGSILSDGKKWLKITCSDGYLLVKDLQLAGKKRMGIEDFLRGFPHPEKYKVL